MNRASVVRGKFTERVNQKQVEQRGSKGYVKASDTNIFVFFSENTLV